MELDSSSNLIGWNKAKSTTDQLQDTKQNRQKIYIISFVSHSDQSIFLCLFIIYEFNSNNFRLKNHQNL